MKKYLKNHGQGMIEFALMIPFLLFLVMGLFDLGRGVFYFAVLNNAAREGTRYAVVQPYCDYRTNPSACTGNLVDSYPLNCQNAQSTANVKICNRINESLFSLNELSTSSITINHALSSTNDPVINIAITFSFQPITPGVSLVGELPLRAGSQMMMTPIAIP